MALIAMWLLGAVALATVITLQQRADSSRQAQLVLFEIRNDVAGLGQLAHNALPGPERRSVKAVKADLVEAQRAIQAKVALLGRLDPDGGQADIERRVDGYFALIYRVLPFIGAGDDKRGSAVFGQAFFPGGQEFELGKALAARDVSARKDGDQARSFAYVGSALAMVITLLAFSLTLQRAVRSGRRAVRARERVEALAAQNEQLLAQSRQEAVTDALTGLGNRRKLFMAAEDLDVGSPAAEIVVGLFDLDGFKAYNDTFGHPAGDALLTRLAQRLTATVEGRGTAYRMGGDEFCVLAHGNDSQRLLLDAQAALSDHGEGFSIRCSYGSAEMPTEADTLTHALQLADNRLYADKRLAHQGEGREVRDALMQLLSDHNGELATHSSNVATLAVATAHKLGLTPHEITSIRLAAELHDVGKAAIPETILNKPGPLTKHEWEFVRRHTLIGERIVAAAPSLAQIAPIVRSSHERPDGSGYPDGLTADAIPLGSRIVAVVDAFDAITSGRAYQPARSTRDAIDELRSSAGRQFDASVVEAFIAALEAATAPAHPGAETQASEQALLA